MNRYPFGFAAFIAAGLLAAGASAAQICSLGSAGPGQAGALICKDTATGATTQSIDIGRTAVGSGGTGGSLTHRGGRVLVTNVVGGALLFKEAGGLLKSPIALQTNGQSGLSGALSDSGAYVVTATRLLFFPFGSDQASSSQRLLSADGSAAQVALAGGFAYVSEKNGSLEAFPLADDGNLAGSASPVAGIPAGVIVGITALLDLVVAPVAHLASNPNQAAIPVVSGGEAIQLVETKEVAACWAAHHDREVCITNPGSMTISCGQFGPGGFTSYTSAAAHPAGEAVLDLDMSRDTVGVLATHNGAPVLLTYARSEDNGDFLTFTNEIPLGTAKGSGAMLLPAAK